MTATRTLILSAMAAAIMPGASLAQDSRVGRDIAANRVTADGKGETQPVTRSGECKGAQSVRIVACLQPDRRVHVEVTGTRGVTASSR